MPDDTKTTPSTETNIIQPGQIVGPSPAPQPAVAPPQPVAIALPPTTTPPTVQAPQPQASPPDPTPVIAASTPPPETPVETPEEVPQQTFADEDTESVEDTQNTDNVTWTASEYIEHQKNFGWYALLGVGSVFIAAIIYLITRDTISVAVIIFGAIMLGVYGARPPRQLTLRVDQSGLVVGQKHFEYSDFRSFSIVPEGALNSIVFLHHKRFAPLTTIYYATEDEDDIIDIISVHLPLEEHRIDVVERLIRHARF